MVIFKLMVLSYMHTTLYISFFYSNNTVLQSSMLSENTRKSLNQPLPVANFSMRLVQNSLRYVNIMTVGSILGVFLFKTGLF